MPQVSQTHVSVFLYKNDSGWVLSGYNKLLPLAEDTEALFTDRQPRNWFSWTRCIMWCVLSRGRWGQYTIHHHERTLGSWDLSLQKILPTLTVTEKIFQNARKLQTRDVSHQTDWWAWTSLLTDLVACFLKYQPRIPVSIQGVLNIHTPFSSFFNDYRTQWQSCLTEDNLPLAYNSSVAPVCTPSCSLSSERPTSTGPHRRRKLVISGHQHPNSKERKSSGSSD